MRDRSAAAAGFRVSAAASAHPAFATESSCCLGRRHVGLRRRRAGQFLRLLGLLSGRRRRAGRLPASAPAARRDAAPCGSTVTAGCSRTRRSFQFIERSRRQQNRHLATREFVFLLRRHMRRKNLRLENQKKNEKRVRRERHDRLDQLGAIPSVAVFVEKVDLAGHENVGFDEIGRNVFWSAR